MFLKYEEEMKDTSLLQAELVSKVTLHHLATTHTMQVTNYVFVIIFLIEKIWPYYRSCLYFFCDQPVFGCNSVSNLQIFFKTINHVYVIRSPSIKLPLKHANDILLMICCYFLDEHEYICDETFDEQRWVARGMPRRKSNRCHCNMVDLGKPRKETTYLHNQKYKSHSLVNSLFVSHTILQIILLNFLFVSLIFFWIFYLFLSQFFSILYLFLWWFFWN